MSTARAKVTSKGQITLPKAVREALGIDKASVVEFEVREGEAVMRPATGFLARFGTVRPRNRPEDWKQVRAETMAAVAREVANE
jgi:AbrB family looped-hinge helix DNA binding protein